MSDHDPVNHPSHYTSHPSGIECIEITRHMGFNPGNALKYIWRSDMKGGIEDLEKAIWYLQDEIEKRKLQKIKDEDASYYPSPHIELREFDFPFEMKCPSCKLRFAAEVPKMKCPQCNGETQLSKHPVRK